MAKSLKILTVDDFFSMRRIVKNLLKDLGYDEVLEADDGSTAWKTLEEQKIDFIISDWNMPKMTGLDLLKKVRSDERMKGIPFLMVTAESEKGNVIEAVQAGVTNYIVKPFTPEVFKQKVEQIIAGI
ncbi:MAG: response regulator [Deltaproteobacteria bacterium]|nr:response regulator [Deltaproteobacteria bacterium]